jgi:hypothetical protein
MAEIVELSIVRSGWAMWCRVSGCKQRMVIRYAPGDVSGAVLAVFNHVKDHHWYDSVEVHCNHKEIVQMIQENKNPESSPTLRDANLIYRMLSRCIIRAVNDNEIPEAVRLSKLCAYLG